MLKKLFWMALLVVLIPSVWYLSDLPDTDQLRKVSPKTSAIRTFREEQIRKKGGTPHSSMEWRSLYQISPHLQHAVLLAEDDAFFQHHGFDIEQLKNAARTDWERKRFAYGGSTLTQQLARTLYLSSHKNLLRKAKEALIAIKLEKSLSKNRILELYLNTVEWGPQVYGAEAASQYFFKKAVSDLSPEEAISLAAILPSPRKWNPMKEEGFMGRRKSILYDRMVRSGYILPVVSTETVVSPDAEPLSTPIIEELPTPEETEPVSEDFPVDERKPDETVKE